MFGTRNATGFFIIVFAVSTNFSPYDFAQIRIGDFERTEVKFFLFTTRSPNRSSTYDAATKFQKVPSKSTKFVIHGYLSNSRMPWLKKIKDEYLKLGDVNVFLVDWELPARHDYISSAVNTRLVGYLIGEFIVNNNISSENVHLIGHSLGAHAAGFAAKKILKMRGEKVARITGLDPALPYFALFFDNGEGRLDKSDGKIVDVIHTDAGVNGVDFAIGTLDIVVNGGYSPQAGCLHNSDPPIAEIVQESVCSHMRSVDYFIEWINRGKFICKMCKYWNYLSKQECTEEIIIIWEETVNENIKGICITHTFNLAPFLPK